MAFYRARNIDEQRTAKEKPRKDNLNSLETKHNKSNKTLKILAQSTQQAICGTSVVN